MILLALWLCAGFWCHGMLFATFMLEERRSPVAPPFLLIGCLICWPFVAYGLSKSIVISLRRRLR